MSEDIKQKVERAIYSHVTSEADVHFIERRWLRGVPEAADAIADAYQPITDRVKQLEEALRPFAAVAANDIGESETDTDVFRTMSAGRNHAPLLTVGDLRRARNLLNGGSNEPE